MIPIATPARETRELSAVPKVGETWRLVEPRHGVLVVLVLGTPEERGVRYWHDTLVLDVAVDPSGWIPGQRGMRWTICAAFGWERIA